jgi:hypothetical protein
MGVVYQARQVGLNRVVALKMILAGGHPGEADLGRFRTEAEAIARLQHPNIVQVYEVGEHDGQPFLALEFCPGGSLDRRLNGTPLEPRGAAGLVRALAGAMQEAHRAHVIHRDLKPANVLLAGAGPASAAGGLAGSSADFVPKVTDFGLAKKLDEAGQTRSGVVLGTPEYMAPEQARGETVGPAADVYALGAVLYECLTGRPPFKAATALDTLRQVVADDPVPPRQLQSQTPRDLETICLKCLRKEPAKRYASAEALAEDLGRYQAGEPIQARPAGLWERGVKWTKRRPAVAALVVVSVLAVLILMGGSLVYADRERRSAEEATKLKLEAQMNAEKERQVVEFLINLFRVSGTLDVEGCFCISPERGERLTLRELLDEGARKVKTLEFQPAVRAVLLDALGNAYRSMGMAGKAIPLLEKALEIRRLLAEPPLPDPGQAHLDVAASLHNLAWAHHHRGDYDTTWPGPITTAAIMTRLRSCTRRPSGAAASTRGMTIFRPLPPCSTWPGSAPKSGTTKTRSACLPRSSKRAAGSWATITRRSRWPASVWRHSCSI